MGLLTVNELWAINGYTGEPTESEITALTFYINVVSETIKNYTRRRLESGSFIDEFHNLGKMGSVHTGEYPITAITSVTLEEEVLLESIDYHVDREAGIFYGDEGRFAYAGGAKLVIAYTAGYFPLPFPIQQVVLDFVNYKYLPPSQVLVNQETAGVKQVQIEGVGSIMYEGESSLIIGTTTAAKLGGPVIGLNFSLLDPYVDLSKAIQPNIHRITTAALAPT